MGPTWPVTELAEGTAAFVSIFPGCHVITMTVDLLKKLSLVDRPLERCSLDTVQMFYRDAQQAGCDL